MPEPPEPCLSDNDAACDIQHLQDVLGALEFLRNDAARTAPSGFREMIVQSLTFLCEAYRHSSAGKRRGAKRSRGNSAAGSAEQPFNEPHR
jgi:hypothetical protein